MAIARDTMQAWIDARQTVDDITYGLRSVRACGNEMRCTGPHAGQLFRACAAAAPLLGRDKITPDGSSVAFWLKFALSKARDQLRAIEAEKKTIGGVRQLRLALAA